jgi:hypothetical protein
VALCPGGILTRACPTAAGTLEVTFCPGCAPWRARDGKLTKQRLPRRPIPERSADPGGMDPAGPVPSGLPSRAAASRPATPGGTAGAPRATTSRGSTTPAAAGRLPASAVAGLRSSKGPQRELCLRPARAHAAGARASIYVFFLVLGPPISLLVSPARRPGRWRASGCEPRWLRRRREARASPAGVGPRLKRRTTLAVSAALALKAIRRSVLACASVPT